MNYVYGSPGQLQGDTHSYVYATMFLSNKPARLPASIPSLPVPLVAIASADLELTLSIVILDHGSCSSDCYRTNAIDSYRQLGICLFLGRLVRKRRRPRPYSARSVSKSPLDDGSRLRWQDGRDAVHVSACQVVLAGGQCKQARCTANGNRQLQGCTDLCMTMTPVIDLESSGFQDNAIIFDFDATRLCRKLDFWSGRCSVQCPSAYYPSPSPGCTRCFTRE